MTFTCIECDTIYEKDRSKGEYPSRGMCRKCYQRWYRKHNKERIKETVKRYIEKNKEKHLAARRKINRRQRAEMSKEEKQAKNKREWESRKKRMTPEEREKRRQHSREYYQKNKERFREQRRTAFQRRRARQKQLPATLTHDQWLEILQSYDHRCAYCGQQFDKLTRDRIIPVVNGGGTTMHNIVPACRKCNRAKGMNPPPIPVQPVLL